MTDDTRLRRLDALFAEGVMGCKVIFGAYSVDGQKRGECGCPGHKHGEWDESDMSHYPTLPHYTRSLDAAWEGAETLCKRTGPPEVGLVGLRFGGASDLAYHATVSGTPVGAPHPAEALVLACLRAVGCSEEELA